MITNSPSIVMGLMGANSIHVTCTAGDLLSDTGMIVGPHTVYFINEIDINKAFISCSGISLDKGINYNYSMVAEVMKTVINSSKEVNLLADSTKFNEAGITSIGPVTLVQRIFTDDNLAPHLAKDFRNEGIELIPC